MTRIVLLTGSELRHDYVRKALAGCPGVDVVASICEGMEKTLVDLTARRAAADSLEMRHLAMREQCERDFFGPFVRHVAAEGNPVTIPRGTLNTPELAERIDQLAPDMLVSYGCSLVREPLLSRFAGRFLNVHLGLSPYYRGAGTNFWPFVNGEPEYAGATFMHIDAGVDTGAVIHQVRAEICPGDTIHHIGNRLISRLPDLFAGLVRNWDRLPAMPQPARPDNERVYRNADFSAEAVAAVYRNFADGLVDRYLAEAPARHARVPLVENPAITDDAAGAAP